MLSKVTVFKLVIKSFPLALETGDKILLILRRLFRASATERPFAVIVEPYAGEESKTKKNTS